MGEARRKHVPTPVELWNPGAVEQWLEHEAEKGWRLDDVGTRLAHFEAAEPGKCRVRLYPIKKDEEWSRTQSRRAAFREMGWSYAAENNDYEFYYCNDVAAPELDTDPMAQQWAWERSLKRSWREGWLCIVMILLLYGGIGWLLLQVETPVRAFVQNGWAVCLAGLMLIPDAAMVVRQLWTVYRVRKQLKAGVPLDRGGDWKTMRRRANLNFASWVVVMVLMLLINIIMPLVQERDVPLDSGIPYVAAEKLDDCFVTSPYVWSRAKRECTILMPESYHIWEYFPEQTRAETTWERLRFAGLAAPLYQEMLAEQLELWPKAERTPITYEGFDEAILLEYQQMQYFLARQEKVILSVWANGGAELSDNLEDFSTVMTDAR